MCCQTSAYFHVSPNISYFHVLPNTSVSVCFRAAAIFVHGEDISISRACFISLLGYFVVVVVVVVVLCVHDYPPL